MLQVKKRSKKLKADGDGTSKESDGDQPNKETECSGIKRKDCAMTLLRQRQQARSTRR